MGLDMYLNAKRYLWDLGDRPDAQIAKEISEKFPELGQARVKEITAEVGYWRKANAIHKWFVDNVQGGVDECQESYVRREDLEKLLETVNTVLKEQSAAGKLLPPSSGFFFGSTDIDQCYWEDLEHTKSVLEHLLNGNFKDWEFYYRASW